MGGEAALQRARAIRARLPRCRARRARSSTASSPRCSPDRRRADAPAGGRPRQLLPARDGRHRAPPAATRRATRSEAHPQGLVARRAARSESAPRAAAARLARPACRLARPAETRRCGARLAAPPGRAAPHAAAAARLEAAKQKLAPPPAPSRAAAARTRRWVGRPLRSTAASGLATTARAPWAATASMPAAAAAAPPGGDGIDVRLYLSTNVVTPQHARRRCRRRVRRPPRRALACSSSSTCPLMSGARAIPHVLRPRDVALTCRGLRVQRDSHFLARPYRCGWSDRAAIQIRHDGQVSLAVVPDGPSSLQPGGIQLWNNGRTFGA